MHAERFTTASICSENSNDNVTSTDVLIIGFGFSVIPLLRELERDGINYTVISSSGQSIWDKLEKHARLDFDMVSSMHTSLYSFELVKRDTRDRYLTSREYASFIKEYLAQYEAKVIRDWVTLVENHATHSIVRTQSGRVFATKHLVIATAFKRRMNQLLNEFDYASARNKTIAFTAIGDSVNLMISKLIPYNNRIILVTNGAVALDKLSFYDGDSYTLDQLEYHNLRHLSNGLYRKTIFTGVEFVVLCETIFKFLGIEHIYFKHPLIRRKVDNSYFCRPSPVVNGIIAIKYWPIDTFQTLFDNGSLKRSISDGYLLNDIGFFLEQGLIELWPRQETVIDREQNTIRWKDNIVKYDSIVDADYEVPNLPEIVIRGEGGPERKYEYICRNNFMGVVPKELNKVYFIGYIRPTTGGLNNITEMQCLFTHKLITDPGFNQEIYENIEQRIRKYDRHYRPSTAARPTDHLVHYGFYTDDVARLMKTNPRLRDCRSFKDLVIYFLFPNAAFKFRQDGPYKVDGVKEMVQQIYKDHKGFSVVLNYLLTYGLLQLTAYIAVIMTWYQQTIYFPTVALPVLLLVVLFNPVSSFVAANGFGCNSYVNIGLVAALVLTAFFQAPLLPIASLLVAGALTYVLRRLGWSRAPFNDLRNKKNPKYREFFKRYGDAFREVFSERYASTERHAAQSRSGLHAADHPATDAPRVAAN